MDLWTKLELQVRMDAMQVRAFNSRIPRSSYSDSCLRVVKRRIQGLGVFRRTFFEVGKGIENTDRVRLQEPWAFT